MSVVHGRLILVYRGTVIGGLSPGELVKVGCRMRLRGCELGCAGAWSLRILVLLYSSGDDDRR